METWRDYSGFTQGYPKVQGYYQTGIQKPHLKIGDEPESLLRLNNVFDEFKVEAKPK